MGLSENLSFRVADGFFDDPGNPLSGCSTNLHRSFGNVAGTSHTRDTKLRKATHPNGRLHVAEGVDVFLGN